MIQGTTPTHTFTIPFSTNSIVAMRIAYEQKDKIVLTKELEDCELETYEDGAGMVVGDVSVKLTQEETMMFDANIPVRIQMHIRDDQEESYASKPVSVPVYVLLDRRVI